MRGFGHAPFGRAPYGDPYYVAVVTSTVVEPDADLVTAYMEVYAESLPPGPLWDVERDTRLLAFCEGEARELARAHAHLEKIIIESNPATTDELLLEWEDVFGLPNECAPLALGRAARQAAVRAAFLATGGQTPAYIQSLLLQVFGVDADILEGQKTPFTTSDGTGADTPPFSGSVVGDQLHFYYEWFEWTVFIYDEGLTYGNPEMYDRMVCFLDHIKPAHTTVTIAYSPGGRIS